VVAEPLNKFELRAAANSRPFGSIDPIILMVSPPSPNSKLHYDTEHYD